VKWCTDVAALFLARAERLGRDVAAGESGSGLFRTAATRPKTRLGLRLFVIDNTRVLTEDFLWEIGQYKEEK
jgi:hypothetical protein